MNPSNLGPPLFAQQVAAYLRHYRALGLRYRGVEYVLSALGRYLLASDAQDFDAEHYESWRRSRAKIHSNSRRKSEQIVRRFCLYRRRLEPTVFVPSADTFSRLRPYDGDPFPFSHRLTVDQLTPTFCARRSCEMFPRRLRRSRSSLVLWAGSLIRSTCVTLDECYRECHSERNTKY